MRKYLLNMAGALALIFLAASCATSTRYLQIITPHTAADLIGDNVEVFIGASYDEAAVMAGEAGYEVILSYEGRSQQGLFNTYSQVRVITKDADGKRPKAER